MTRLDKLTLVLTVVLCAVLLLGATLAVLDYIDARGHIEQTR